MNGTAAVGRNANLVMAGAAAQAVGHLDVIALQAPATVRAAQAVLAQNSLPPLATEISKYDVSALLQ